MGRLKIEGGLLTFFPRKGDLIKGGGVFEMGGLDRGFMVQTSRGGDSLMKQTGVLVGNFEFNP